MARYKCQNCETLYKLEELRPVKDLLQRVEPGEPLPAGQCPDRKCGAVCHEAKNDGVLAYMECPDCGGIGPFKVEVSVMRTVYDNGDTQDCDDSGDTEWSDESYMECCDCGAEATALQFTKPEPAKPEPVEPRPLSTVEQQQLIAALKLWQETASSKGGSSILEPYEAYFAGLEGEEADIDALCERIASGRGV